MMNINSVGSAGWLFMQEATGYHEDPGKVWVDTHESKVNAVIDDLRRYRLSGGDPNNICESVLRSYGLSFNALSDKDMSIINSKVFS